MSIELSKITFTYSQGTPFERRALENISVSIEKGEIVAIIGHTGSGKSTLVQHLNALLRPEQGTIMIDGVNAAAKSKEAKAARHKVGMVFQYPEHQLFAETVEEDIAFAPRNKGFAPDEVKKLVQEAMRFVGLDYETYAKRSPFQLSGGQMRRVAVAGVVALNPDYLVLDEPSAGLDPISRKRVFQEILDLHKKRKLAIVLVTHSMDEAVQYADRLLVINKGKLMYDGAPSEIFKNHSQELRAVGMDTPHIYQLAEKLKAQGLQLKGEIMNERALVKAICEAKGWKYAK